MTIRLDGKVAIVTGAARGLGRSHALALARAGAGVLVNDLYRNAADAVAGEIVAAGGTAIGHAADVTDAGAMAAMVAATEARLGTVDILVCNAGTLRDRSFARMDLADFRLMLDVHLMGAVHAVHAAWPGMIARRHGRVVLTTSASGLFGNFGQANYAAAKMALVGLMRTLALEGERHDVRVNCLAPTAATEMTRGILDEATLARFSPDAVSPGVVALAAADAPTGTILAAGGGHFAEARIVLTRGLSATGEDAAERIAARRPEIADCTGATMPASAIDQIQQQLMSVRGSL